MSKENRGNGFLGQIEGMCAVWPEEGKVTREEVADLLWFFIYGQNVLSQLGRDLRGYSFRQRETTCLLVVRSSLGDTQQVAFTTGRTPTDCVSIFRRKWDEGTCQWSLDKYA